MIHTPQKIPHVMEIHGDKRVDDYFWMRERDSKPVLDYLKGENLRTQEALMPVKDLETKLFEEMRKRIKEDDSSVPAFDDGHYYYFRYQAGQEYPIHARKTGGLDASEEILLDENVAAKGHTYFDVGAINVSPNHQIVAYSVDTVGRRFYTIHFKDQATGKMLKDQITDVTPGFAWAADNRTLFYVKQDPETLRSYQVYRYELGGQSELVYEEKDTTYSVGVGESKNGKKLFMVSYKTDSTEWWYLDSSQPKAPWTLFLKREEGHEYSLTDGGDRVYILTNWQAKNFRVMESSYAQSARNQWKEVIPHSSKILREGVDVYEQYMVVSELENGLAQLRVRHRTSGKEHQVAFSDPAYEVALDYLPDYSSKILRFNYNSPAHPPAVFDEEFATQKRTLRKQKEVPGFNRDLYEVRRIWANARDGAKVPIAVLMRKGAPLDGKNPTLVYGYGSYGINSTPGFWRDIFSLIDRGFIFAGPQIRGGSDMGREWYEQGRLMNKMNTFYDFIDATEKLIADGYTSKEHVHWMGGSAGGLLMGACMNLRPDLALSVTAQVPFVDVLTTMLDESLPLTTSEYREWGDPREKEAYMYMKKYSPYDNVERKNYPNIFVTTGYHDSQVQYWEPAKWVAKLREYKTDDNLLLFYTELEAGHSGASGRFEALKTLAKQFAFILMVEGKKE